MSLISLDVDVARTLWHPIASSDDLPFRHVFHAQILGRELAVWRADDGNVNVWENRCLHRGVRLSIGVNDGRELICQYHGWRYSNRTAGCTYIPAHPADAPARTICSNTYPVRERYGLVWSSESASGAPPDSGMLTDRSLTLRPIPVNASIDRVMLALQDYHYGADVITTSDVEQDHAFSVVCTPTITVESPIVFFLQPIDSDRTVIRGVVSHAEGADNRAALLRSHNDALTQLRRDVELSMVNVEPPAPLTVTIRPVSELLASMPELSAFGRAAPLRVQVAATEMVATDIKSLELTSIGQPLPTFQPGAHIDVHLPNGLVRQYSLINAPGQTDRYVLGIKREAESDGGSAYIHDTLKTGDTLAISVPRNNFPLRRDAVNTVLIAGGIGVTPLLSMAQALHHSAAPFRLHYFTQAESYRAFPTSLNQLGDSVIMHYGLSPDATEQRLRELLADYEPARHVYVCGPGPMLETARSVAVNMGWPDEAIHFEYFKNTAKMDVGDAFTVSLARSGMTLTVPAGQSLLTVLRENGVDLPSSCEQGACGTCRVAVLDGEPLHRDVYLNVSERQRGDCLMTCVSRAQTDSLTLDI